MSDRLNRLYKLGGISFIASGSLFLVKSVLERMIGEPPSSGLEILEWVGSEGLLMAIIPEIFFFAVMFLIPAVIALYDSLARTHRSQAVVGCGIMAATIPIFSVLLIVHGRLIYPVYGIKIQTAEVAEFVVAIYYGGLHTVALLLAVATVALSLAMRHGAYGRNIAYLGFATAAFDLMSAYPDAVGPTLTLVSGIFFAAWFVAVGFRLYRFPAA